MDPSATPLMSFLALPRPLATAMRSGTPAPGVGSSALKAESGPTGMVICGTWEQAWVRACTGYKGEGDTRWQHARLVRLRSSVRY